MKVLIVHAHPEPQSFNGALVREAVAALGAQGHESRVSDLYRMGFDPVSDRRNFLGRYNADRLDLQAEESHASAHHGFAQELQMEMDKLDWCTHLVFQFPIWWLGLPAILKGWVDRVFAAGRAYGGGRWFAQGVFAGKRAMCAVSVGGLEHSYGGAGVYGPVSGVLHPVHQGIFAFTGFSVIEPFVVYGPGRIDHRRRQQYLREYAQRLLLMDSIPACPPEKFFSTTDWPS